MGAPEVLRPAWPGPSQPSAAATSTGVTGLLDFSPVAAAEHREAAIDREAGAALGCAGGPATSVARTIAACGSGYTDRVELLGYPPVAAAEPARLRSTAKRALLLNSQEVLRTFRSLRQRLHRSCRTIGLHPCSRCRAPRGCDRPRSGRRSWGRRRSCDHRSLRQRLQRFSRALRARSRRRAGCGSVCFRTGRRSWPAGGGSRLPPHWCRSRSSCPTRTR